MMNTVVDPLLIQHDPQALHAAFVELRKANNLRHRDAAHALGITEGQAMAVGVGNGIVRLRNKFIPLFEEMPKLGPVMALTRNETTVHERIGQYAQMSHQGMTGLALGEIDLRIFYSRWAFAYAVTEETSHGTQRSLQFYDAAGDAIHKVFLREQSDLTVWETIISQYRHENQERGELFTTRAAPPAEWLDSEIDVAGFQAAWAALQDTHDFFPLLRKFNVSRTQALRLAAPEHARQVSHDKVRIMLNTAAEKTTPIMCFVGNQGMIQIYSGLISNVIEIGGWINVMDVSFNLHLRQDLIDQTWIVRKPTADGIVTSLELFDAQGESMAMFFGERKPGKPELDSWRDIMRKLEG